MKKNMIFCWCLAGIIFCQNVTADNEVLSLQMNESSWNGTTDEVVDSSAYGNHGTANGNATTSASGKIKRAGSFSGTSGEYVDCGSDTSLQSPTGSIAFWMKADTTDTILDIVNIFEDGFQNFLLIRRNYDNKIYILIEDNDVAKVNLYSNTKITDTNWHHVVVTQDGTGIKIFIDGQLSGVYGTNSAYWTDHLSLSGAWIGGGHWTSFDGLLDEVKIYDYALNAEEIFRQYFNGSVRGNWHFDEGSGTSAGDSSGWENTGTIYGTATWEAEGKQGSALEFDGSSNYVDFGNDASLKSQTGSIEFWMKPDITDTTLDIVNIFEDSYQNFLLIRRHYYNKIYVLIEDDDVAKVNLYSNTTMNDTNWHHIVVTQDGSGIKIYIDGQLSGTSGTNSAYWTNHLSPSGTWIGKSHWLNFDGLLDEVKIYDKALNSSEISNHYIEGCIRASWHFDEGSGTSVEDSSGNGNNATIYGTANWVDDGRPGSALEFDGSSTYIDCGSDTSLQSPTGSIEFWMKADTTDTMMDVVNVFEDSYQNFLLIRRSYNNKIYILIEDDNVAKINLYANTIIADTDWHHVVVTQDGTGIKIYIDGQESSLSGTNSAYWTDHLSLSGTWFGKGHWTSFDGLLDEAKIYNRALSSSEISQHYLDGGGASGFGCEEYTEEPIGGGAGYSQIYTPDDADYYVDTQNELTAAINAASSGDIIFIDFGANLDLSGITVPTGVDVVYEVDTKAKLLNALSDTYIRSKVKIIFVTGSSTIDLSGEENISIPGGIVLASDRGYNSSSGALLKTDTLETVPLFRPGANVLITGLRLQGDGESWSDGILCELPNLEVSNCEISFWIFAGIYLNSGSTDAYIHNNYFHNCCYGVCMGNGNANALIKANKFDYNRHSIAGTGRKGNSYEACYNLVLGNGTSHAFDMHGERDFRSYTLSAIWRFDEGSGSQAADTSVFNNNDGTIYGTVTWKDEGMVKKALEFDGSSTYIDFGSHTSLQSEKGCIEFWMKADTTGTLMEVVNIYEDSSQNYLLIGRNDSNKIFVTIKDDNIAKVDISSDTTIADTSWHHIVVVQDGTGVDIYIDGQASSLTGTNSAYWTNHLALSGTLIGKGPSAYFDGVIDETRIYSQALSTADIALHASNGHADWAGDTIKIHHNTFEIVDYSAILVRGIPNDELSIHHNWFFAGPSAYQQNAEGNMNTYMNLYSPSRILIE